MIFDGFIGGSYESVSVAWDAQRAMNLYVEADESKQGKSNLALIGTPGLTVFMTLPTSPVRGSWTGLADNLPGSAAIDLAYCVAGSKLYQLFRVTGVVNTAGTAVTWVSGTQFTAAVAGAQILIAGAPYTVQTYNSATSLTLTASAGTQNGVAWIGGAYTQIGDVGTDATNSPATLSVNGSQIFITSAGLGWLYNGFSVFQVFYNIGTGTVDTLGTAVTWDSGTPFSPSQVGSGILIGTTPYVIKAWVSDTQITLYTSAGTQSGQNFSVMGGGGTFNAPGGGTPIVNWQSGNLFTGLANGSPFIIGQNIYNVSAVNSPTQLVLTSNLTLPFFDAPFSTYGPVLAAMGGFIDTYFWALPPDSKSWNLSGANDGTMWNPLDYAVKEGFPDNIASMLSDHEELWLFGSETTEPWEDTGAAAFPFQRNPGTVIRTGCRAPFSPVSINQGVAWIGGDERGNPVALFATGFQPERISTHAIETQWATYPTVTDATAFIHILRGHQFWVINFPSGNATWVWDATAGLWHERGWWNGASIDRHRGATHGYAWGQHLVGDWSTGQIYILTESAFTDAGTQIVRNRTAPHISNEELYTYYSRIRVAMQAGPNPTMQWADDSGQTFNAPVAASGRLIGAALQESAWRRLGKGRDRVYSMTITDACEVVIVAAYLDVDAGSA